MKEIGSEFWEYEWKNAKTKNGIKYFEKLGVDIKYLMSGRTAIDYILNNFNDKKKIVYMPEYCCASMVQPFIDNGYNIAYYKVDLVKRKYYIDENFNCSIFFAMSYFGYNISNMDSYIKKFKLKNIIVLEDITHRILCENSHCKDSDYLIASLRKWFPIYTGAIAVNKNYNFKEKIDNYTINRKLIKYKEQAMKLKREYMLDMKIDCKDIFLELFNKSNKLIADYKNKRIDEKSLKILENIDIEHIRKKRIHNSIIIEENLKNSENIRLLYNQAKGDCPLFVPIILKNRDYIRKKLIENNIYCPIHWSNFNNFGNDIYINELSLICDQRYNEEDMKKEVKIIFENI